MAADSTRTQRSAGGAGSPAGGAPHCSQAVLHDYRAHRLPAAELEWIAGHLAACEECRELAADVDAFFASPGEGAAEGAFDQVAGWASLRDRLAGDGWFDQMKARRAARVKQALVAAAAVVALAVVGLYGLFWQGAEVTVLVPVGAFRGGSEGLAVVKLPATLQLNGAGLPRSRTCRAEISTQAGRLVARFDGIQLDSAGRVLLRLRRWRLPSGTYRLLLEEPGAPGRPPLGEYEFRVAAR